MFNPKALAQPTRVCVVFEVSLFRKKLKVVPSLYVLYTPQRLVCYLQTLEIIFSPFPALRRTPQWKGQSGRKTVWCLLKMCSCSFTFRAPCLAGLRHSKSGWGWSQGHPSCLSPSGFKENSSLQNASSPTAAEQKVVVEPVSRSMCKRVRCKKKKKKIMLLKGEHTKHISSLLFHWETVIGW